MIKFNLISYLNKLSVPFYLDFYFIFILPVNPEDLTQYNWVNQSLIELKLSIIDLIILAH